MVTFSGKFWAARLPANTSTTTLLNGFLDRLPFRGSARQAARRQPPPARENNSPRAPLTPRLNRDRKIRCDWRNADLSRNLSHKLLQDRKGAFCAATRNITRSEH